MIRQTISKEFTFAAAHVVPEHPKCGRIHGHNWRVEVTLSGAIEQDGMIVDFGLIKELIHRHFDHMFIAPQSWIRGADPGDVSVHTGQAIIRCHVDDIAIIPDEHSPSTCENLVNYMLEMIEEAFDCRVETITLWETEGSSTTIYRDDDDEEDNIQQVPEAEEDDIRQPSL